MTIDLCEHNLPIRTCEICREAADLLGKGDNVLISRAYLTEWVREAQREWVGLTDEEISAVDWKSNETLHDFARAVEALLKRKNT